MRAAREKLRAAEVELGNLRALADDVNITPSRLTASAAVGETAAAEVIIGDHTDAAMHMGDVPTSFHTEPFNGAGGLEHLHGLGDFKVSDDHNKRTQPASSITSPEKPSAPPPGRPTESSLLERLPRAAQNARLPARLPSGNASGRQRESTHKEQSESRGKSAPRWADSSSQKHYHCRWQQQRPISLQEDSRKQHAWQHTWYTTRAWHTTGYGNIL